MQQQTGTDGAEVEKSINHTSVESASSTSNIQNDGDNKPWGITSDSTAKRR